MTLTLLDAGPIVALLDRSDQNHERCAAALGELETPLVTCEPVLSEACYLLRNVTNAPSDVLRNVERGDFLVPYQAASRASQLARLIEKYSDIGMDLADACLVDMASELRTGHIFTLDSDFKFYRWGRNRSFDSILDL